jgi:hypothetical protein
VSTSGLQYSVLVQDGWYSAMEVGTDRLLTQRASFDELQTAVQHSHPGATYNGRCEQQPSTTPPSKATAAKSGGFRAPINLSTPLVAIGLLLVCGLVWLVATHLWIALAVAFVGGGLLFGKTAGEEGRRARWKRDHGLFLTDDDRMTLATQSALAFVLEAVRRLGRAFSGRNDHP